MTENSHINLLLNEGEGLTIEFKKSYTSRIAEDFVAFANTRGGTLLLGVQDDGKVVGEKLTNSVKAQIKSVARNCSPSIEVDARQVGEVVEISVPEGREKPYQCSAGYFRRIDGASQKMSTKELRLLFRNADSASFEDLACLYATIDDISRTRIRSFIKQAGISGSKVSVEEFLTSFRLLNREGATNAAVLLFGKEPKKFFPQCSLLCLRFSDDIGVDILDRMESHLDLVDQFETAITFIKKHLNRRSIIESTYRRDVYDVPEEAFREAVTNAIIHRDYSIKGSDILVKVFNDRVEIINPGGIPEDLGIRNFGKMSIRRNEMICEVFQRLDLTEKAGTGIRRMKEAMAREHLPPPSIHPHDFFHIQLTRFVPNSNSMKKYKITKDGPWKNKPGKKGLKFLNNKNKGDISKWPGKKAGEKSRGNRPGINAEKILVLMAKNPSISIPQLSALVGISARSIEKNISKLKTEGLLKRSGPAKTGRWEVVGNRIEWHE